jgi:exosortase F-associated protein
VGQGICVYETGSGLMFTRVFIGSFCVAGLVLVFLFQRIDIAGALGAESIIHKFLINRSIRFLVNDALAIGLIYALFMERKYVIFSVYVQLAGMVLFLFPYFILKIYYPAYNGPLISFLHRLILNPTLLMLLIPAFYYQRSLKQKA